MRTSSMKKLAFGAALALLAAAASSVANASDLQPFTTEFNTDWTWAGVGGLRGGNGQSSITLGAGVGAGTVTAAFVYWHGPTNTTDTTANNALTFNGTAVTGTSLGLSNNNCWGFNNSQAYRADVKSIVNATGSGVYSLDFTKFVAGSVDLNGASLVVFYNDGNPSNNRDVVLWDGNDSNINNSFDANGWNISLNGINCPTTGCASAGLNLGVSDGQTFLDDALHINGNQGSLTVPAGAIFQGTSVPGPNLPNGNGNLWDLKSFDITSVLGPGLNNISFSTGVFQDCLSCVHIAIDLPAGTAPPTGVPEPGTLLTFGAGLAALAAIRRRRKS